MPAPATAALSTFDRPRALDRAESDLFDCVIVGGGITGAGIAREAGLRGLRVALLEADDFAAGTSSRSSKLIHGGLRYLALGDVATVRSTALERKIVHRIAPHLATPEWMLIPTRSWAGAMKMRAAVTTYEKLGSVETPDLHRTWNEDDLAREEPLLDRERFRHAVVYREYVTDDARLVLANLRAAAADGALLLSRVAAVSIVLEDGAARGVHAVCRESGRRLRIRARCVVNAAGPWVDALRAMEHSAAQALLHLSKGVHIVLPRESLPLHHVVVLEASDRRSIFVVPRGRTVYVGTTDTSWPGGHVHWPRIELADVVYLLEPLARAFSITPPRAEDVIAAWAGLRPLISEPGRPPAEISRRDEVMVGPAGMITIAGGKLTGYRPMARATLERAAELHGLVLRDAPDEDPPLPGGDFAGGVPALAARIVRDSGLSERTADRLARLYGAEAIDVTRLGAEPLVPGSDVISGEIEWALRLEAALHLEDLLYRRTRAAWFEPDAREALVDAAAERMGALLGWDAAQRAREASETRQRMASEMAFQSTTPRGER